MPPVKIGSLEAKRLFYGTYWLPPIPSFNGTYPFWFVLLIKLFYAYVPLAPPPKGEDWFYVPKRFYFPCVVYPVRLVLLAEEVWLKLLDVDWLNALGLESPNVKF